MYKLKLHKDKLLLYKGDTLVELSESSDIRVDLEGKRLSYTKGSIEDLKMLVLDVIDSSLPARLYYRPYGLSASPVQQQRDVGEILIVSESFLPKSIQFSTAWSKSYGESSKGVADYRKVYNFMPKWSTAYKFPLSTHSKIVEPVMSDVLYFKEFVEKMYKGVPDRGAYRDYRQTRVLGVVDNLYHTRLSIKQASYLKEVVYVNDGRIPIHFGYQFNTIYVQPIVFESPFDLIVDGEYNLTPISERISITSLGTVELRNKYHKIHNICVDPTSNTTIDLQTTALLVSNYIKLDTFKFQERGDDTKISLDFDRVHLKLKGSNKQLNTFTLPSDIFAGMYIDKYDHVLMYKERALYTGKLDAKIDLDIPKDCSFNNSKFIEEYNTDKYYTLDIFLADYIAYCNQNVVAVKVVSPDKSVRYLTDDFNLIKSDTPVYLNTNTLKKSVSITLNIELDEEFLVIQLEDIKQKYTISHLLFKPRVTLNKAFDFKELPNRVSGIDIEFIEPIILGGVITLKVSVFNNPLYKYILIPLEDRLGFDREAKSNITHEKVPAFYESIP